MQALARSLITSNPPQPPGHGLRPPQTPNHQQPPRPAPPTANTHRPQPPNQPRNPAIPPPSGPTRPIANGNQGLQPPQAPQNGGSEPIAFFSARAVCQLTEVNLQGNNDGVLPIPHGQQAFNPKAESPSIRKTPGIDHSSSKPVSKNGQHVAPTASQGAPTPPVPTTSGFNPVAGNRPGAPPPPRGASMANPQFDHTRRIGAPGGPGSPLANRGQYRPPTMKRPLPAGDAATAAGRPALVDVSANGATSTVTSNGAIQDAKRQKTA
jgi:DNA repair and recombination protein RAD52